MKYFFEPIVLSDWYMFNEVCSFCQEVSFYATEEMQIGDMLFFYIAKKNSKIPAGIYGNGIIISNPNKDNVETRLRVNVRIKYIRFDEPIINYDICKKYIRQFRDVHKIEDSIIIELMKTPLINIIK